MKNLICFLGFMALFFTSKAQFPVTQTQGSATTLTKPLGGLQTGAGLINTVYADTVAANLNAYIKTYAGALIYTTSDKSVWYRIVPPGKWVQIMPSGSGVDTSYWKVGGNDFSLSTTIGALGTINNVPFFFQSNNLKRFGLHNTGILPYSSAVVPLGLDTTGGNFYLARANPSSGSSGWNLTGNSISSGDFLGTTNSQNLLLKTNNSTRFTINTNGAFGLGTGTDYGTSGYVLSTNGSSTAPTWVSPSSFQTNIYNSDGTLTGDRSVNGGGNSLTISNVNTINSTTSNETAFINDDGNFINLIGVGSSYAVMRGIELPDFVNNRSEINVGWNDISIKPWHGLFGIDTLNAQSNASDSMLVWAASGVNRGKVGYRTIPTSSGGTVTSIATSAPITGGNITYTGTIGVDTSTANTGLTTLYQNSLKLSTATAASTYLPLAGGTLTGNLTIQKNGLKALSIGSNATGSYLEKAYIDTLGSFYSYGNNYVNVSNYSGGRFGINGNEFIMTTEAIGTGTMKDISITAGTGRALYFGSNATSYRAFLTSAGTFTIATAGAASTPNTLLSGTWYSGGTPTTTKPQLLIEPSGATSTGWSTNGTGIGINAASGFTGNLFDVQLNGSSKASINSNGQLSIATNVIAGNSLVAGGSNGILWNSSSVMKAPSDGIITLLNQALTNFDRIQFGGTTSSFPSLKRKGKILQIRKADDSGYGSLEADSAYFASNVGIGTTSPNSTVEVNGSFGTAITTTTSNLTLDNTHHTVIITGGTPTITLPSAASGNSRREYIIVNQTGSSRTISSYLDFTGASATTIAANSSITIGSDGSNWYRIQ